MSATLALARQSFDPRMLGSMHLWLSAEINGNAGNTWSDLSGSGNNITLTNGPTFSTTGGGAISFDGVNDYGSNSLTMNTLGTSWTFALWVRPTGAQSTRGILAFNSTPNDGGCPLLLQRQSSTNTRWLVNQTDGYKFSQTVGDNVFTHLTLTYDGSTYRAYKNGAADGQFSATRTYTDNARVLWIGNGFNGYYSGLISELLVYKSTLSDVQVSAIYQRMRFRHA